MYLFIDLIHYSVKESKRLEEDSSIPFIYVQNCSMNAKSKDKKSEKISYSRRNY